MTLLPLSQLTDKILIIIQDFVQAQARLAEYYALLSQKEKQQANRFHFQRDRERYIASHGLVRQVLGYYCGLSGHQINTMVIHNGKPALVADQNPKDLRFNLSHSKDRTALALTVGHEVGIDIEYQNEEIDTLGIAKRYFAANEVAILEKAKDSQVLATFYQGWVWREALLKASGCGIVAGLSQCEFTLDGTIPVKINQLPPGLLEKEKKLSNWFLYPLILNDNYAGAVACVGKEKKITLTQQGCDKAIFY